MAGPRARDSGGTSRAPDAKRARTRADDDQPIEAIVEELTRLTRALHRTPGQRTRNATRVMSAALRALEVGRRELAKSTRPDRSHPQLMAGPWQTLKRALDAGRAQLLSNPAVIGVGLGFRRREGVRTGERCVVVMVDRKRSPRALRRGKRTLLPRTMTAGRRQVPVDVVEVGARITRHADAFGGDSIGPRGTRRKATLGTFAVHDDGSIVALTAMHLFDGMQPGTDRPVLVTPSLRDSDTAELLGRYRKGSLRGIDAASIALDGSVVPSRFINGVPIRGWRPLSAPGDENLRVVMAGASTPVSEGFIEHFCCSYPPWNIEEAITARLPSDKGDSGAALLDRQGFVLGLLVGQPDRADDLRVFCSIGSILERLNCDIP